MKIMQYFQNDSEEPRILERKGKGLRVKRVLDACNAEAIRAVFVDDRQENCDNVRKLNPGVSVCHCSATGMSREDCAWIIYYFDTSKTGYNLPREVFGAGIA